MKITRCIFCLESLHGETANLDPSGDFYNYVCLSCGLVRATGSCGVLAQTDDHRHVKGIRHLISGILRWRDIRGIKQYRPITFDEVPLLLLNEYTPKEIPDKIDLLIQYLGLISKSFGNVRDLPARFDKAVTFSPDEEEFRELTEYLIEEKLLIRSEEEGIQGYKLSMSGWKRFYELEKKHVDLKRCFVAMNFKNEYDPIYLKISEAIRACGFEPYRVKELQTNDQITDLIIAGIKKSGFMIADFSGARPSVYYEAGFARGLGKKVIWMAKRKTKLHFDTRQYKHIFWNDGDDLKNQLIARIEATIV
jgi:hypothetical protein